MIDLVSLVILALVAFRLSELVAKDYGPDDLFLKLRVKLGGYDLGPNSEPVTSLGKMIVCPYCVGVYVAFGLTVLFSFYHSQNLIDYFLNALAIAGMQALLQSIGGRS